MARRPRGPISARESTPNLDPANITAAAAAKLTRDAILLTSAL